MQYPKLRNLVLLYVWEDKSLGSLNLFLWYVSLLSGASILCFHVLSFLRAYHREWLQSGWGLMATRWQVFFSFLNFLRAHQFLLMFVTSLFTDIAGNIWFLKIISSLSSLLPYFMVQGLPGPACTFSGCCFSPTDSGSAAGNAWGFAHLSSY